MAFSASGVEIESGCSNPVEWAEHRDALSSFPQLHRNPPNAHLSFNANTDPIPTAISVAIVYTVVNIASSISYPAADERTTTSRLPDPKSIKPAMQLFLMVQVCTNRPSQVPFSFSAQMFLAHSQGSWSGSASQILSGTSSSGSSSDLLIPLSPR